MSHSHLDPYVQALANCTYCPNLCRQSCPVERVVARDSVSPWGLMSLASFVHRGQVAWSPEVASTLDACLGCGACTVACAHDNDVEGAIFAARREGVDREARDHDVARFTRAELDGWDGWVEAARDEARYQRYPEILLLPGHIGAVSPAAVDTLLHVARRLQQDALTCGEASRLDAGYGLWAAGYGSEFLAHALQVRDALVGVRVAVVMSPEALYTLKHVYPRHGVNIPAELLHVTEFLLPFLAGADVTRLPGRTAYHDSCHLARHLDLSDAPRELLQRMLESPIQELTYARENTACCGGTGCLDISRPSVALAVATEIIDRAVTDGITRVVTFSPECLVMLTQAAGDRLEVVGGVDLMAQALR